MAGVPYGPVARRGGGGGRPLIRIKGNKAEVPPHPKSRHTPAPKPEPVASAPAPAVAAAAAPRRRPSRARRLAKDLLPPIVTRAITSRR